MILGKPGAGKTTFLKHIALLLSERSDVLSGYIPVFISLNDFCAEEQNKELVEYIFADISSHGIERDNLEILIKSGRLIFLLDGLDEVKESKISHVIRQIRLLSQDFENNNFIVTCRLAAQAQEYKFENFVEVEICDFNDNQIKAFVRNWFTEKGKHKRADSFIARMVKDSNIRDLATSPLLLTLLCIVFEDSGDFPVNRSELYEEGVDVLLRKWDANRDIYRPKVYGELSRNKKEDLLSHIAFNSFERNEYFFKQKSIENEIRDYIYNLQMPTKKYRSVDVDCREILRSIEADHGLITAIAKGIYSFSHLTFHEYFTSRKIVKIMDPDEQKEVLNSLVEHIYEPRWREIFALVSCMLPKADYFMKLLKLKIGEPIQDSLKIQDFFSWLNRKSSLAAGPGEMLALKSAGQILYFKLATTTLDLKGVKHLNHRDFKLDSNLSIVLSQSRSIFQDMDLAAGLLSSGQSVGFRRKVERNQDLILSTLDTCMELVFDDRLKDKLNQLKNNLSSVESPVEWWLQSGEAWIKELISTMVNFQDIGHSWDFNQAELITLDKYFYASKLLENCLSKDCYVSRHLRESLTRNILLPLSSDSL